MSSAAETSEFNFTLELLSAIERRARLSAEATAIWNSNHPGNSADGNRSSLDEFINRKWQTSDGLDSLDFEYLERLIAELKGETNAVVVTFRTDPKSIGKHLFETGAVESVNGFYIVRELDNEYKVTKEKSVVVCSCPVYEAKRQTESAFQCAHKWAVRFLGQSGQMKTAA